MPKPDGFYLSVYAIIGIAAGGVCLFFMGLCVSLCILHKYRKEKQKLVEALTQSRMQWDLANEGVLNDDDQQLPPVGQNGTLDFYGNDTKRPRFTQVTPTKGIVDNVSDISNFQTRGRLNTSAMLKVNDSSSPVNLKRKDLDDVAFGNRPTLKNDR